jgi:hypothetical protein
MKDVEIIDLIEKLRVMQQKANELAGHQLEMTQHLESAFKKAREMHEQILLEQTDTGGEA